MNDFVRCDRCGRQYFRARHSCPFCQLEIPNERQAIDRILWDGHPQLYDAEICRWGYNTIRNQEIYQCKTWKDVAENVFACLVLSAAVSGVLLLVCCLVATVSKDMAKGRITASAEATSPETASQADEHSLPPQPSVPLPQPRIYSPHSEPEIP